MKRKKGMRVWKRGGKFRWVKLRFLQLTLIESIKYTKNQVNIKNK